MIILSIDVGIKNLGYIIFKYKKQDTKIEILDWDIINLSQCKPLCCKCLEKSSYEYMKKYYCEEHMNNLDVSINKYSSSDINTSTKKKLITICAENNIKVDIKLKRKDIQQLINQVFINSYINVLGNTSAKKVNMIDIGINIKDNFNRVFKNKNIDLLSIDKILIENQIGPIANRMKTVQGMVAQYFIDNKNYNIEFVSSINKLSQFTNKKMTYNEKKKASVEIAGIILDKYSNNEYITIFNNNKKRDDLADSLLQGISYLKKVNNIDIYIKYS